MRSLVIFFPFFFFIIIPLPWPIVIVSVASPFLSALPGFAAILELSMGPSSLEVGAKRVDPRTLLTVWLQYMRARHSIDLAEPSLYSIAHGFAVSFGADRDALAEQLRREWAVVGGYVPAAGAGAQSGGAGAASSAGPAPLHPQSTASPEVAASALAPAAPASSSRSLRLDAATRAAGSWPLYVEGGFSSVAQVGVPDNRPSVDPHLLCPVCVARAHDPEYKVSTTTDGSIPVKQLRGTASTSRSDQACIRTFIGVANASSEAEALSGKAPAPEPPSRDSCTTRYSSTVSAPVISRAGAGGSPNIEVIIGAVCLHGICLQDGIVAGLMPENYRYYFRIFSGACSFSPLQIETLYADMMCQMGPPLVKRSNHPKFAEQFARKVPPFHAGGHVRKCFVSNSTQMHEGGGCDTKELEEEWADLQLRIGRTLPYMSSDRWKDVVQLCFSQMATEKRHGLFELLVSGMRRMLMQDDSLSAQRAMLLSETMALLAAREGAEGARRGPGGAGAGAGAPVDVAPGPLERSECALTLLKEQAAALTAREMAGHQPASSVRDKLRVWALSVIVYSVAKEAALTEAAEMLFGQGGGRNTAAIEKAKKDWSTASHQANTELIRHTVTGGKPWLEANLVELKGSAHFRELAAQGAEEKVASIEADIYSLVSEYGHVNSQLQSSKLTSDEVRAGVWLRGSGGVHVLLIIIFHHLAYPSLLPFLL